jgi:hypothetical protein
MDQETYSILKDEWLEQHGYENFEVETDENGEEYVDDKDSDIPRKIYLASEVEQKYAVSIESSGTIPGEEQFDGI